MTDEVCVWNGASGAKYIFYVYDRPPAVPNRPGNFVYTKLNAEGLWVPVYIGHGELATRCESEAALMACIDGREATHIHMRLSWMEDERLAVYRDMLGVYPNTFPPDGCNARDEAAEPA